jgi:hypothetical protein
MTFSNKCAERSSTAARRSARRAAFRGVIAMIALLSPVAAACNERDTGSDGSPAVGQSGAGAPAPSIPGTGGTAANGGLAAAAGQGGASAGGEGGALAAGAAGMSAPQAGSGGEVSGAGAGAGSGGEPAAGGAAAPAVIDYAARGPYTVVTEKNVGETFRNSNVTDQSAFCAAFVGGIMLPGEGNVDEELTNYPADMDRQLYTLFRPETFLEGATYPVITWGNGTCAQPLLYTEILEHLASHGFIVIATNATSVGSGMEMQRGLDFVLAENERQGSTLFGKVAVDLLGASGHSQGSGATVAVGASERIRVTVPIQGASAAGVRALTGPTFLISGETDTLVTPSSIKSAFGAATVPAVYGMSIGQDHLMPGRMPAPILEALTAWFAIHLQMADAARPLFYGDACGLCSDPAWTIEQKNL